jgi:hypothetical protein
MVAFASTAAEPDKIPEGQEEFWKDKSIPTTMFQLAFDDSCLKA